MKKLSILLILAIIMVSVMGCSTTTTNEGSISIAHEAGTTVIDSPAKRVVVLEWIYGENLLALGVQPVGMTDIPGFKKWLNIDAELSEDVVNLGTRGAANLEEIAALEPDLIISASYYEYDYELLTQIAPTIILNPFPQEGGEGEYGHMISSIQKVATALGLEEKGNDVIASLEDAYSEARSKLKEKDIDFNYIKIIDFSTNDTVSLYLFTDTSLHSVILEKIGFNNVYVPNKFELYGQTNISIENLVGLDNHSLMLIADKGSDVFSSNLISQEVLDSLGFYANEKMYYLGSNASAFGPLSTLTFIDTVVKSFTENE